MEIQNDSYKNNKSRGEKKHVMHIFLYRVGSYLIYANIVALLAFNNRGIVIDIQDVDGEGVVRVSGR